MKNCEKKYQIECSGVFAFVEEKTLNMNGIK